MKAGPLVIALAASSGWPAAGGAALVQKNVGYVQGPSFTLAFDAGNTAGNAIVVFAFWEDSTRSAVVFDSQGNAYASVPSVANFWLPPDRGSMAQFFFATGVDGGTNAVTIQMEPDAGTAYHTGLGILEYSGLDPDPLEGSAIVVAADASNAAATPAVTPAGAEDLLLGGFNDTNGSGAIDAGPGWTSQLVNLPFYILVEDRRAGDAGAYQAVATMPNGDADWVGAVLALKAMPPPDAGADAGPNPLPGEYAVDCGCASTAAPMSAVGLTVLLAVLARRRRYGQVSHP
jgi:MYXO-CTERM domain-containing protein